MIRRLRTRHRILTRALALVLPAGFIAAVSVRSPIPAPPLTPVEPEAREQGLALGDQQALTGRQLAATMQLFTSGSPPERLTLSIRPASPINAPDVLAYWHPMANGSVDALPPDAFLLGGLNAVPARRLPLPAQALQRDGTLILYSLAHQRILNAGPLASYSLLTKKAAP